MDSSPLSAQHLAILVVRQEHQAVRRWVRSRLLLGHASACRIVTPLSTPESASANGTSARLAQPS